MTNPSQNYLASECEVRVKTLAADMITAALAYPGKSGSWVDVDLPPYNNSTTDYSGSSGTLDALQCAGYRIDISFENYQSQCFRTAANPER